MDDPKTLQIPDGVLDQSVAALYAAMRLFRALPPAIKDRNEGLLIKLSRATSKLDHAVRTARK